MANTRMFFSDLNSGRCFSVVEARNIKRGGEFMWVDMLLLDVNVSEFCYLIFYILIVLVFLILRRTVNIFR